MPIDISIDDLTHHFGGSGPATLADISLDMERGETLVLLGASGCGKTTLLRLIAGLLPVQHGRIQYDPRLEQGLSFVFQSPALLPWATLLENVCLPQQLRASQNMVSAQQMIADVGLADKASLRPFELSGGQQMRVSIARALASGRKAILLDEPFAALDEVTRHRLAELFDGLRRHHALTTVFVTHNISEAVFLGQTIVLMGADPGRIVAQYRIAGPAARTAEFRQDPAYHAQCAEISAELSKFIGADA